MVIGAAAVDGDDDGDYFLVLVLFLVVDEADCLVGGLVGDVEEGSIVLLELLVLLILLLLLELLVEL